jgi:hypothetical protein
MIWPEGLIESVQLLDLSDCSAFVLTGERFVNCGMPILSCHDKLVLRHQPIGDGDHIIAGWHCESTAGKEVVLDVD